MVHLQPGKHASPRQRCDPAGSAQEARLIQTANGPVLEGAGSRQPGGGPSDCQLDLAGYTCR